MDPDPRGVLSCAPLQLTPRDRTLIDVLARRVKLLPVHLARRLWWPDARSAREMDRRLAALESAGLVVRSSVVGRWPELPTEPLQTWMPDELPPDMADVVWRARCAAQGRVRGVRVLTATRAAAGLCGGSAQPVRPSEVSHDLRVAAVFASKMLAAPETVERWQGESVLGPEWRKPGEVVPDAVLALPGRAVVVEVVGTSYTPGGLRDFHRWAQGRGVGYELW